MSRYVLDVNNVSVLYCTAAISHPPHTAHLCVLREEMASGGRVEVRVRNARAGRSQVVAPSHVHADVRGGCRRAVRGADRAHNRGRRCAHVGREAKLAAHEPRVPVSDKCIGVASSCPL